MRGLGNTLQILSAKRIAKFTLPSENQTISNTAMTDVSGTWTIQDNNLYSASGAVLTIRETGIYAINIQAHGLVTPQSYTQVHAYATGYGGLVPTMTENGLSSSIQGYCNNMQILQLVSGTTIRMQGYTSSASNELYGTSLSPNNFISIIKLS